MGLTLYYELRLPAETTQDGVADVLRQLRDFALELPFQDVSQVASMASGEVFEYGDPPVRDNWLEFYASLVAEPYGEELPQLVGDVSTTHGFLILPGEGCEPATFGLLRRGDESGAFQEWHWHCWCKTQYASIVSTQHFVRCHTSLIALLDRAIAIGVDVVVSDETGYWEARDERRLIEELDRMNHLMAAFAGKLSDMLGPGRLEASIFEHPRFERLEMGEKSE